VKRALLPQELARNTNELTQERSRIPASIVISALLPQDIARNMSESTQERSRIHASIAKSALSN